MKTYKFYFEHSNLLGSISPMIERGDNLEEAKADLLLDLNSMLGHDGIQPHSSIESIVKIRYHEIIK